MSGSSENRCIRLEVISGQNIQVPSDRIPAGICIFINVDSQRRWKSAIGVLSSDRSVVWRDTETLSSHASRVLSVEIRASYEVDRMLGSGEVIGKLQMSWDELLSHGDEPFNLSFPPVRGVHPSLTLKATVVHGCEEQDGALPDSLVDREIARDTDAGHAQFAKYVTSETVSHLNAAVEHFQLVLDQCPVDHPDHAAALTNLAWARLEGYIRNNLQDIDTTASLFRDALALRPQRHPDHPLSLYNLTKALNWRHNKKSAAADIREAAQLYHELLPLCPEGTYLRSIAAGKNGVGYVIGRCNNLAKDTSDEGICLRRVVLELCPVGHQHRSRALDELSEALRSRFMQSGNIDDLDEGIQFRREVVSLCPEGHPDHPHYLNNFALLLMVRFNQQGKPNDLDEAISLHEEALRLRPPGHKSRLLSLDNLGGTLRIRFKKRGDIDDITRAVSLYREAVTLCLPGHPIRPRALDMLSEALRSRFMQNGNIDDLDEGIQFRREVASLCPEGHPDHPHYLNNFALSLMVRFDHQGKPNDLDEAISLHEEALRLRPAGHEFRLLSLDNLGGTLRIRFKKRGDIDDITRAVSLYREAVTLCLPGHSNRDTTLNNLALALNTRYDKMHVREDIDEAIDRYRESLRLRRLDHPERHRILYNLSSALCSRFTHTREDEDVEEAITLCQEVLASLPSLHPDMHSNYNRLQQAHLSRYEIRHNPADLLLAVENFRLASGHPTQGFPNRIETALRWVDTAEGYQHDSALEAYQVCLELFDSHVMTRSSIISRREAATAFSGAHSLPVDAASCAIRRGNLRRAVELMEQGRGQQWSLASRLKTPVEDLESTNPTLARNYLELSKRVSNAAHNSATIINRAAADRAATEYRRLTRQWEAAVVEIRDLRAFSRFLLPPVYEDLQAAAHQGPVIILIASQYSCSAIIIPTSGESHHVPLSSISLADLTMLKDRFTRAIRHASRMNPAETRTDLIVLLRIVWDEIMLPIVHILENVLKLKRRSRIWLCPTAAFTSIPLHAANPFITKADRSKEPCLEDLYVCSYTPTLSALVRSRRLMKKRVTPSFVAIGQGQPGAGKGKALLAVDSELKLVHKLVPATANRTTVSGDAATRVGALKALEGNTWVHLACHGKQDPAQPYHSHFVMRDEHVTLLDIMERDIPHAEFAFLSACHTAVGDKETPDEVIHLAAGLQFSGFKSVVGTLWEVDDAVAKHVVKAFYKYMFNPMEEGVMDCTKAAWALNCATHAVKTKVPLEQRMVFVHIGV